MTSELHRLTGAYAVDALEGDELRAFEAHLQECAECQIEVAEFRETLAQRASVEAVMPPARLKGRVVAEVAMTRQLPPQLPAVVVDLAERRRLGDKSRRMLTAAAAAIVLVVGTLGALSLRGGDDQRDAVVAAPDAVFTDLGANAASAEGMVRVIWSPERDAAVVIGSDLAPISESETYELWFLLEDGSVAPAGLFRPQNGSVDQVIKLDDVDGIGWGISVEPAAGSEQPTGEVLFVGTLA